MNIDDGEGSSSYFPSQDGAGQGWKLTFWITSQIHW